MTTLTATQIATLKSLTSEVAELGEEISQIENGVVTVEDADDRIVQLGMNLEDLYFDIEKILGEAGLSHDFDEVNGVQVYKDIEQLVK